LKEGALSQHVSGSKPQERILYLFTDLVVVAKPTAGKKYECKGQVALEECRLINTADTSSKYLDPYSFSFPSSLDPSFFSFTLVPTYLGIKHAFELHHKKDKYVFLCSGVEEKNSWVREIQKRIKEFQRNKIKKMNEAKKS
jgi:hypothetical protein